MQQRGFCGFIAATFLVMLASGRAAAAIDLRNADVEQLDNGMTVILLEDRNFPVVSTQMLYRVGARDESYGQTGIAHFLEHMAFRASENFPDTGLVSSIYAVGGEWHGYTWTDQTTYFATVPKEQLDLLLRIEADRMTRLEISPDDMEAERGAVLAEMHMYENYPTSMLLDAVMFTSFLAHPYRNNTIGWESDIENLKHEEVVAFYERHYKPANAVLAIVGDFDRREVLSRVRDLFGDIAAGTPTPLPHTVEPLQDGERRVRLQADTKAKRFMIGWRAPSANHPDFAAFLVLQELLGAGSGVNFRQNDFGTPIREGDLLYGVADEVTTWYPPSAQDYIFIVGGSIAVEDEESRLEREIEQRLDRVRQAAPGDRAMAAAIEAVLKELAFDVETTEDAAHQLAYFDGLRALDELLALGARVAGVTAAEVQRAAQSWLLPERRTIAWHVPDSGDAVSPGAAQTPIPPVDVSPELPPDTEPVSPPEVRELGGGVPAIVQRSDLSQTAYLQIVVPGNNVIADEIMRNDPVAAHSTFAYRFTPDELERTVGMARTAIEGATIETKRSRQESNDPETRLEEVFASLMFADGVAAQSELSPALIVVSGNVDAERTFDLLEAEFGGYVAPGASAPAATRSRFASEDIDVRLGRHVAQAQLGYIVPAPPPGSEQALACRVLLYILSHDYEGRLGKEAISNRGLAYYIDSRYRSDGSSAWVTLAVGVDPGKVTELEELMKSELERLREEPPTAEEIEEAKHHLVGRARSSAQSNRELSAVLAENWLWYGEIMTPEALVRSLSRISRQDILDEVSEFTRGITVVVDGEATAASAQ